jgi:methylenetetrahydrofolate--tRNA-(uracil-5-)-methyltransferase
MNVNFGLFPPLAQVPTTDSKGKRLRGTEKTIAKKQALCLRALADLQRWASGGAQMAAAE